MIQVISRNKERGTAQVVVKGEKRSMTLHLERKAGSPNVFKTKDIKVEEMDENGEPVKKIILGEEFNLAGLQPMIDTPSQPSNPEKGRGKGAGGKKKSREERDAEKTERKAGANKKGKGGDK